MNLKTIGITILAFCFGLLGYHLLITPRYQAAAEAAARKEADTEKALSETKAERDTLRQSVAKLRAEPKPTAPPSPSPSPSDAQVAQPAPSPVDFFSQTLAELSHKASQLSKSFTDNPEQEIPEFSLLAASDWIKVAENANLQTAEGTRMAMAAARHLAKDRFANEAYRAIRKYMDSHDGNFPSSPADIAPYFANSVDPAILARYQIRKLEGPLGSTATRGVMVLDEQAPVDPQFDSHIYISDDGITTYRGGVGRNNGDPDKNWLGK